jgi:uncharacterized protein (DUF952 family)
VNSTEQTPIFHIALERDWAEAQGTGVYGVSTRGATVDEVGFIHASFEAQLAGVASRYYAAVDEPLVVLVIDPDRLDVPLVIEEVEGAGEAFPHIYGPLPVSAVVGVRRATVTADGQLVID